jgi:hypothetical protein
MVSQVCPMQRKFALPPIKCVGRRFRLKND